MQFVPEIAGVIGADAVQVDHPAVGPGAVSHQIAAGGLQIDRKSQAVVDQGRAAHQGLAGVQLAQLGVRQNGLTPPQPQLVQPHAGTDQDRKAARADLGEKGPVIAFGQAVEFGAVIGDQPGQQVKPAGRGFGIGHRRQSGGQRHPFHQRHQINAATFQDCAPRQVHLVHLNVGQAVHDPVPAPRQKAGAQPIGDRSQPQIKAGGLDLFGDDRGIRRDRARPDQVADAAVGKNAVHAGPFMRKRPPPAGDGRFRNGRAGEIRTRGLPPPRRTR